MKKYNLKSPLIYLFFLATLLSFELKAQDKAQKDAPATRESRDDEKLKSDIEKELEQEDLLEADHQQMHEDERIALEKAHNKSDPKRGFENSLQEVHSEKVKDKLLTAHNTMEQAASILLRAEEKIARAKEKLADPEYIKQFTPEELSEKESKLNKAIEVLAKARENHQIYNAKIDEEVSKIQNKQ